MPERWRRRSGRRTGRNATLSMFRCGPASACPCTGARAGILTLSQNAEVTSLTRDESFAAQSRDRLDNRSEPRTSIIWSSYMLDSKLLAPLIALGIVAVVFMICRAIVLWYFRVNETVALLRSIDEKLGRMARAVPVDPIEPMFTSEPK